MFTVGDADSACKAHALKQRPLQIVSAPAGAATAATQVVRRKDGEVVGACRYAQSYARNYDLSYDLSYDLTYDSSGRCRRRQRRHEQPVAALALGAVKGQVSSLQQGRGVVGRGAGLAQAHAQFGHGRDEAGLSGHTFAQALTNISRLLGLGARDEEF